MLCNEYAFTYARGPTFPPHDHGAVAVIDGNTIKFTPFRTANVPPPMAMCEVDVESAVVDVAISDDCSKMAVLHQDGVSIFTFEEKGPRLSSLKLAHCAKVEGVKSSAHGYMSLQVAFAGESAVQVLQARELETKLLRYDFDLADQGTEKLQETDAASAD